VLACVVASSVSLISAQARKIARSAASPLSGEPAALGFAGIVRTGESRQTNNTYYIHDLPPLGAKPQPKIVEAEDGDERSTA